MEELANAILKLDWQDMDALAQNIRSIATNDDGELNDERYIAQCLIDYANDINGYEP
jgi:hypothetical protein